MVKRYGQIVVVFSGESWRSVLKPAPELMDEYVVCDVAYMLIPADAAIVDVGLCSDEVEEVTDVSTHCWCVRLGAWTA